jgi:hypothetical protein
MANTQEITLPKSYKFNDRRGTNAGSLYPNVSYNIKRYTPRWNTVADTRKTVTSGDRHEQLKYGRELFASMPNVGAAISSKNKWAVGSGWLPEFNGKNQKWGETVSSWLTDSFFKNCNVLGQNYDFRTSLFLSGIAIDVDGDSLMAFTTDKYGFPQIILVPSHRIGQRDNSDEVKGGRYDGYNIYDGVIVNTLNRPIAYRILGDTKDDDKDIPASNVQLLFEPEWADQFRGISRLARPLFDLLDIQDIDEFVKRAIKVASRYAVVHSTADGQPTDSLNLVNAEEDIISGIVSPKAPPLENIFGGEILYANAPAGEKIEFPAADRPSANEAAAIERLERRVFAALGWPYELLDPIVKNGGAVRLIQDLARQSISDRQVTLERRAQSIISYAIATGMENGIIPQNKDADWLNWRFTRPAKLTVDAGNEASADRDALKLGISTLEEIAAKKGQDWTDLRKQSQIEVIDLLTRAQGISKQFGISLDKAIDLLSQRTPNGIPAPPQQVDVTNN